MLKQKNNNILKKIFIKKIFKFIKYFSIFYYNIYIWIYIIILIFIFINKNKYYKIIIYNKYKYLINFLFIILLLNKCQKSDLN
uniref:Open reading frame 78 n=1 Tax=Plasmodium coatneyi TaxID=208452 RepID=H7CDL9_9APIC|nr:open reading frame 78 [Plasmodium coatneyi]